MKKKFLYGILITVLIYSIFYRSLPPYAPITAARLISGLKIPRGVLYELDESHFGFTGSGHIAIIIAMDNEKFEKFIRMNNWKKFKSLPIKDKSVHLPIVYDSFFEKSPYNHDEGYYKMVVNRVNSETQIVVDCSQKKIFIYETY